METETTSLVGGDAVMDVSDGTVTVTWKGEFLCSFPECPSCCLSTHKK